MITFPCRCGHVFNVTEDQAGGTIQCPRCGRLNDIPLLSDLPGLADDGTVKLDGAADGVRPGGTRGDRLAEVSRAFSRRPVGAEEIDLRPTLDEVKLVGEMEPAQRGRGREKPKYDPVTGELIRPLDVRQDAARPPEEIPVARRALTYVAGSSITPPGAKRLLVELLHPINLFVMFIILAAFVLIQVVMLLGLMIGAYAGTVGMNIMPVIYLIYGLFLALALSHYANVIDEVGREGRDELPRPLRELNWQDDVWGPLWKSAAGGLLCYWPIFAVAYWWGDRAFSVPLEALLLVAGSCALPAVWITLICDGTFANLRPDRLWSVMRACGGSYFVPLIAGVPAVLGHAWGLFGLWLLPAGLLANYPQLAVLNHYAVVYSVLLVGIYFAHYCCWYMGILYRLNHDEFRWVMQRHTPRTDPRLQRRNGESPTAISKP